MSRMTIRNLDGSVSRQPMVSEGMALFRLAAYEDALTLERAQELAQAEKDGRLVVLPCKVGGTVYEIEPLWLAKIFDKNAKCRSCHDFYEGGMGDIPCCLREEDECLTISKKISTLSMIADWIDHKELGKTVFLAHEEAEAALKKREEGQYVHRNSGPAD